MSVPIFAVKTQHFYRSLCYASILVSLSMMPFVWKVMDHSKIMLEFSKTNFFMQKYCPDEIDTKCFNPDFIKSIFVHEIPISYRFFYAIQEWCLGTFAVVVSAVLNWLETIIDEPLEGPPSRFTAFSFIGGLYFLIFYFVFDKNESHYRTFFDGYFFEFIAYLFLGVMTLICSILSIGTIRRVKDRRPF
jgi:hypothetical protein